MSKMIQQIKLRQLIAQRKRDLSDVLRADLTIVYWNRSAVIDANFLSRAQFALSTQTGNTIVFQANSITDETIDAWVVDRTEFINALETWVDVYNRAFIRYSDAVAKLATLRNPNAVFEEMTVCALS